MALGAGVIAVLYFGRQVFIPLAIALTLAFLLTPVVSLLQRCRMPRFPAVILAVGLLAAGAGSIGWVITGQLLSVVSLFPQYKENIHNRIQLLRGPKEGTLGTVSESVKDIRREIASASATPGSADSSAPITPIQVEAPPATAVQYLENIGYPLVAPLTEAAVVLIFAVFMLVNKEDLRNRLLRLAGVSQLNVMTQALDDAAARISRYLVMQSAVNVGFGVVAGVGLHFLGVPNAGLWGVLAAILRIVPYVGSLIAATLPFLLSLAVFTTWWPPMLVLLLYAALELVTANLVEPWLYGAHTGISPLAILVTTVGWAMLWGPAGLVLATPLTVCLVVLGRHVPNLSFLHILLGDDPVLSPEAQVYQRLLAMDPVEARQVVDQFLAENSLLNLYDLVLIPALTLAEQDRHKGALDQAREQFLFLNVGAMISELAENEPEQLEPLDSPFAGRVICYPVDDEADHIAASMLAHVLEQMGCPVITFPAHTSLGDLLSLKLSAEDVIVTSAVPPLAFAHSRTICKRLRAQLPGIRILAGIWGFSGHPEKAKGRFDRQSPDAILTTLAGAARYIAELNGGPASERDEDASIEPADSLLAPAIHASALSEAEEREGSPSNASPSV
jgi:predicted PurR-regulated permease PerM